MTSQCQDVVGLLNAADRVRKIALFFHDQRLEEGTRDVIRSVVRFGRRYAVLVGCTPTEIDKRLNSREFYKEEGR